ncbi:MAG: HupE/UreJ family protein [Rhodothermales bacterium]|nr:HupE/UreJ family protein [Rhodothermales bacterium]
MKHSFIVLLTLVLGSFVPPALALPHADSQSYVYFRIYDDSIQVRLEITVDDLNRAMGLSLPYGEEVDKDFVIAAIRTQLDSILTYMDVHFYLGTKDGPLPVRFSELDLLRVRVGDFVKLTYSTGTLTQIPPELTVEYSALFDQNPEHRNLVHVEHNWKTSTFSNESNVAFILSPDDRRQTLDLTSSSVLRGFMGMIRYGVHHIMTGFDHLLFLIALILPSVLYWKDKRWLPVEKFRSALFKIVAIVSFFTIAHTITLSLAALKFISLPSILVESVIAGSIAVAAMHNLLPRFIKHESIIAFVFGLFHGFGFASLLEPLALGGEYTVLTLLGFNLGVEVGQVVVIAAIFPFLYLVRKQRFYKPLVLSVGSVLLIAVAAFWFVERAFDPPALQAAKIFIKDLIRPMYYAVFGA